MKLNYKQTILIGLAFLSISAFWQMYDNIIPLILKNSFELGETVTGVIMAADNILALFLLPVFGLLSDRTDTKIGKRMPFIIAGTALSVVFLLILPAADRSRNLVLFIIVLFLTLLSMGLYRSPSVALMPDLTQKPLRSKGNAVINLMGAVGGVYSLIMIQLLVGNGITPDYFPLFLSIALLMIVCIAILFFTVKEKKILQEMAPEAEADTAETGTGSSLPPDVKRSLIFMLSSIALWFIAYNAVTTAFSRYATHVWGMENGGYANCLMVATVAAIISYMKDFRPLAETELAAVHKVCEIIRPHNMIPCTACRYCTDGCPQKISIPDLFACLNAKKVFHNWNTDYYYNSVHTVKNGKASDCIRCGKCEQVCPQHLHIRELLEDVAAEFE